jgi:CAAX prenyl protease-like protein
MAVLAQRSGWFAAPGFQPVESARPSNPTAAFLVPFLAILAAGMLAQATSGGFEWAYPMRIVAALVALAVLRRGYAGVDWSISWAGPVAGIVVFALWIVADRGSSPMPAALAAAPGGVRNFWIAMRVFGACVTVPVAEELAFRGYAMRRLVAVDFETVPLSGVTWVAVAVSSILFGAIHGPRWPAGIAAGLIFAYAARRRGKLGDAVAAHAVANGLLACFVLYRGAWQYW